MKKHVIFYDGDCPLCNRSVHFLLGADKKKIFYFAPLNGETASEKLKSLRLQDPNLDTLVLLEGEKLFIQSRAVMRILWLLGGKYALLGWISFLPSALFDFLYRWVAKRRYQLFSMGKKVEPTPDRFLK